MVELGQHQGSVSGCELFKRETTQTQLPNLDLFSWPKLLECNNLLQVRDKIKLNPLSTYNNYASEIGVSHSLLTNNSIYRGALIKGLRVVDKNL